jgi:hypothetical protein
VLVQDRHHEDPVMESTMGGSEMGRCYGRSIPHSLGPAFQELSLLGMWRAVGESSNWIARC